MKRVLLVDDHDLVRRLLTIVLEQYTDFKENIQADSLAEARRMQSTSEGKADLAIVDLDLPNGDGFTLIEELRKADPDIRVVALSTNRDAGYHARAVEKGADKVLCTAASGEEIIAVVRRLGGG